MWDDVREMRFVPAFVAASALLASTAHAGGFYLGDIGTRGMARGGAFVASPDSLLSIHYNPAGLSQLQGLNAEASVTFVNMGLDFNRKCPCLIADSAGGKSAAEWDAELQSSFDDNVVSSNTTLVIPFVGASYGLPFYDLTFGVAAWGPNSGRHDWGEVVSTRRPDFATSAAGQPGRYSGMRMANIEANFAAAVAAQPIDGLRIGASVMLSQAGNNQTLHLWANSDLLGIQGPEDANYDAPVLLDFNDYAINWSVGASYELLPGLTIGSSFRGSRPIDTEGTIEVQVPSAVIDADPPLLVVNGSKVRVQLENAPIFRAGVQYRLPHVFAAEAAVVWEGWGVQDEVVITPIDIELEVLGNPSPLGVIRSPRNWKNTYSLRLGGELNLFDPLVNVVGGYFYEPTAIPSAFVDPSRTDFDKHGFSLGARTTFFGFTLDVSGAYILLSGTQIRDSAKPIAGAFEGERQDFLTNVGNGDYSGGYFMVSTALSFALDPLMGAL